MNNKIENTKKEINIRSASFTLIEVIIIILITSLVVGVATSIIVYRNYNDIKATANGDSVSKISELEEAYNNILNGYVEKIDENELVNAAIKGMYNYIGDPYTTYLDEETTSNLMDRLNGEYYGLGVEFTKTEEGFVVVTVFDGSPAKDADIKVGDFLVKVNGEDLSEKTAQEVANMIRNNPSRKIKISVTRGTITLTKDVTLSTITIPAVSKEKYDNIGYIKIETFSNTTYSQFKDALESLEKEGIDGLVIDVRNNGGGYLTAAVDIAELFLEKGKNIYGLKNQTETKFYEDSTRENRKLKVAVLINSSSASASEILAAALKESYGATLVGTTSYGKGTVQETNDLKSGGMVKYTTAYWLTPNGNSINQKGLEPDIKIEALNESNTEKDVQLNSALEALR